MQHLSFVEVFEGDEHETISGKMPKIKYIVAVRNGKGEIIAYHGYASKLYHTAEDAQKCADECNADKRRRMCFSKECYFDVAKTVIY